MALIVEDGTIVANANSYVSVATITAYALARGITITGDVESHAINAMDYYRTLDLKWKGEQVSPGVQTLAWPRKNVLIGCTTLSSTTIPGQICDAQCQISIYVSQGIALFPVGNTAAFVKREKIGPIETEYSEQLAILQGTLPELFLINTMLGPFLVSGGRLRSVRV